MDELTKFVAERLGTSEGAEHPSVIREREQQEALKARAEHVELWRRWVDSRAPLATFDGSVLRSLREGCDLSTSEAADICGVDVGTVEACENGSKTFADAALSKFSAACRDALIVNEEAS